MAITKPLLISIDELKFICSLSGAFDSNYLSPLVLQASDLASQNVLGTALMVKLRTDFNAETLTGIYDTLYDSDECSVLKMIAWQSYSLGLIRMLYKIGAETISAGDTDEVSPISKEDLGSMQRAASASKSFYENRVKSFLLNNWADIPKLSDNTLDYIKPNTEKSDTSQGMGYSDNIVFNDF